MLIIVYITEEPLLWLSTFKHKFMVTLAMW